MSEPANVRSVDLESMTIDDLARLEGAQVVESIEDLRADIFESDEELEEFLADLRSSRNQFHA